MSKNTICPAFCMTIFLTLLLGIFVVIIAKVVGFVGVPLLGLWLCCMWGAVISEIVIFAICSSRKTKESTQQDCTNLEPEQRALQMHHQGLHRILQHTSDISECVLDPSIPSVASEQRELYTVSQGLHRIGIDSSESASNPTVTSTALNTPVVLQVVLPPNGETMVPSAPPPPYEEPPAYHTLCDEKARSCEDSESRIRQLLQPSPPAFQYAGQGTLV